MQDPFFSPLLLCGTLALLLSLLAWVFGFKKTAIALLVLGGLGLRLWAALLDPFLHTWDEGWHAAVAKNFTLDPLTPRLRREAPLPYNDLHWCCTQHWLHKPPLALWQAAASVKWLGNTLMALRLPSAVLGALQVLLTFRVGQLCLGDRAGYLAALLFACSFFHLELTSGNEPVDVVDVSLLFYTTASIWAWCEFQRSKAWKWVVLVGLLAGLAVLAKWMTGLLVFAGWGVGLSFDFYKNKKMPWGEMLKMVAAMLVAMAIFLPWDLYTAHRFPAEYTAEKTYNWQHIIAPLEGHSGGWDFYLKNLKNYFFPGALPVLLLGVFFCLRQNRSPKLATCLVAMFLGVWLFFSLVAQTKMPAYVFVTASLAFLFLAAVAENILSALLPRLQKDVGNAFFVVVAGLLGLLSFRSPEIADRHADPVRVGWQREIRTQKIHNTKVYQQLGHLLPDKEMVVINLPGYEYLDLMFFSDHVAYGRLPEATINQLLDRGVRLAAFRSCCRADWFEGHPQVVVIGADLVE